VGWFAGEAADLAADAEPGPWLVEHPRPAEVAPVDGFELERRRPISSPRHREVEVAGDRGHQPLECLRVEPILPAEGVQDLGFGHPGVGVAVVVGQSEVGRGCAVPRLVRDDLRRYTTTYLMANCSAAACLLGAQKGGLHRHACYNRTLTAWTSSSASPHPPKTPNPISPHIHSVQPRPRLPADRDRSIEIADRHRPHRADEAGPVRGAGS
jgi:hypothetical protein